MKTHLRIPHFQALVAREDRDSDGPFVVVDDGRILDATPEALDRNLNVGDLLETTAVPEDVAEIPFDLNRLETHKQGFLEAVRSVVPVAESFGYGEVLAEMPDEYERGKLLDLPKLNDAFPLLVAGSPTGWLARVLCHRLEPGDSRFLEEDEYFEVLDSIRPEEFWGLGRELPRRIREESFESLGALRALKPARRRQRLGPGVEPLNAIFEGRDPRPLNPFSRPATLRRGFTVTPGDPETVRSELRSTVNRLSENLRTTKTRTHRLRVTYSPATGDPRTVTHTYSSSTDEDDVLTFGAETLLGELSPLDRDGDLHVEVDALVPNLDTYHSEVENNPEDLRIL